MSSEAPLRICIVVPYDLAEQGGVRHHAFDLANALRSWGDEVSVIGPTSRAIGTPGAEALGGVVPWRSNGATSHIALFVSPLAVWRYFQRHPVDLVHVHEPPVPSLPHWVAWLLRNTPKVCTFHSYAESPGHVLRTAQWISAGMELGCYERAIAVSHAAARYAGRVWKRPLCIIPNGVSTEVFRVSKRRSNASGPTRLLFVGRLRDPRKGFPLLLEAYRMLKARAVNVTLDVVGDLAGASSLPVLPGLRYFGALPLAELVERYQACDAFVAPSTGQESFGIVLLEAMSCARPVVCSDIGGYREVAHPDGACLVPPGDAEALAGALESLAASPKRRDAMGVFNARYARRYRWPEIARRVRLEYLLAIEAWSQSRGAASERSAAAFASRCRGESKTRLGEAIDPAQPRSPPPEAYLS